MQKKLEIKNLWEDLTSKQKQLLKEQKELEELLEYQVTLKVCSFNSYICNHCICKDMKMHEYRCTLHWLQRFDKDRNTQTDMLHSCDWSCQTKPGLWGFIKDFWIFSSITLSWALTGRKGFSRPDAEAETPILWPPHAKSWLIGKDPDAGRDWGQEEKGTTEDEMAGWHHRLSGHEFK